MKPKRRQSGVTLTEMTVVIAVVAMFTVFGLPAIRTFFSSFETQGGTKAMISAALASARAIAAKEQHYAGIRFQKAYDPDGPLKAPQYMVFIIQDPNIGAYFFRAVEDTQPIKLPETIGVMDFTIVVGRNIINPINPANEQRLDDPLLSPNQDDWINDSYELRDTTAFSIVFSPSGKLVIHGVRVRNRDGEGDSPSYTDLSNDDIFNKMAKVNVGIGTFYQDDYFGSGSNPDLGLGPEPSRSSFVIYDREKFRQALDKGQPYSAYLYKLVPEIIYINPYTGTIIDSR